MPLGIGCGGHFTVEEIGHLGILVVLGRQWERGEGQGKGKVAGTISAEKVGGGGFRGMQMSSLASIFFIACPFCLSTKGAAVCPLFPNQGALLGRPTALARGLALLFSWWVARRVPDDPPRCHFMYV